MLTSLKSIPLCRCASIAAGSIALLTLPALAGTPKALTMVPGDSEMVVVLPNLGELLGDMDAINAMMGDMGKVELMMVTSMVRGMPGINLDGSAAIVLDMTDGWEGEPDAVVVLPVSDFGKLTQGREAVDGLVEFPMGSEQFYFRDIGNGFAAMSNDTGILSGFVPASNTIEEVQATLGAAGNRVAEANDVMIYVNLDSIRPMLEESFVELEAQGDMIEMMAGAEAAQGFDTFMNLYRTAVGDGQAVVGGFSFDADTGFAFDLGLQFSEGSESAALFNNDGNADSYFGHVPDMDFFFAYAFDMSGVGIEKMFDGYFEMIEKFDTTGMFAGMDLQNMMKQFSGGAAVMGGTNIMAMNGLLGNTVMYTEGKDADAALEALQGLYGGMGAIESPGMSVVASFADEPEDVNGVQAYAHSMSFDIDAAAMGGGGGFGAPDPAMIMQMLYGPTGGPSGYTAKAGDGLVFTFSQDGEFLSKAVKAANGEGTMMSNTGIALAAALLPDNRVLESYVGVDHILNTVGPMLMMFGIIPDFEPMDGLTPLAFGATADGGGMLVRMVLPFDTVKAVMELVPADALGMLGGGDDDDWDSEDEDDDDMSF
ncbi:MAG: hypothetical protein JKY43_01865 [Phycisphaerales bacterium]|nr:hypothetical protein [Phycisphaerales bacterium]